jgi:hypothetical protein
MSKSVRPDIVDGLYCVSATSSKGRKCLCVLDGDVRKVGLPKELQNQEVPELLLESGYKAVILPDKVTGTVNMPLGMAGRLKACGVMFVDEALLDASPRDYVVFKAKEKEEAAKNKRREERLAKKRQR